MKTAVIYARFSCSRQREASIEDQLRVCEQWCAEEGYKVVARYCDRAISGRTDDRPEFQRMVESAGESDIVLVYMMDRFSRDPYDAPIYKKRLRDKGVRVVSATESMPDGPEAVLMEKIYEGMAAVESAHISLRTKRGMHGNALKCMHNGVRVFGYRFGEDGRYEIDEAEASVVREVFRRRAGGESPNSIAKDMASRGYLTYAKKPVTYTWVRNMLDCEKYKGIYKFGDVRIEGGMPRILDDDEWWRGHSARGHKMRTNEDWGDYILKRLKGGAVCRCGMTLVGISGRGRGNKKYEYYKCSSQTRRDVEPCEVHQVRRDWLESSVAQAIRSMLGDRETALEAARAVETYIGATEAERAAKRAREREREAARQLANLKEAVRQGMPYELARDDIEALVKEQAAAAAEAETIEQRGRFDAEDFADFLQYGATLDDKSLVEAFAWQVILDDEWVTVKLNYDLSKDVPAQLRIPRGSDELTSGMAQSEDKKIRTTLPAEELVRTDEVWLPFASCVRTKRRPPYSRIVVLEQRVAVQFSRSP